jgi:hypothetical protein
MSSKKISKRKHEDEADAHASMAAPSNKRTRVSAPVHQIATGVENISLTPTEFIIEEDPVPEGSIWHPSTEFNIDDEPTYDPAEVEYPADDDEVNYNNESGDMLEQFPPSSTSATASHPLMHGTFTVKHTTDNLEAVILKSTGDAAVKKFKEYLDLQARRGTPITSRHLFI